MTREIDAPADDLREDAKRAKRAAKETDDPKKKRRLNRIAEDNKGKAVDIENDFA
jgi:hypothetical protein